MNLIIYKINMKYKSMAVFTSTHTTFTSDILSSSLCIQKVCRLVICYTH